MCRLLRFGRPQGYFHLRFDGRADFLDLRKQGRGIFGPYPQLFGGICEICGLYAGQLIDFFFHFSSAVSTSEMFHQENNSSAGAFPDGRFVLMLVIMTASAVVMVMFMLVIMAAVTVVMVMFMLVIMAAVTMVMVVIMLVVTVGVIMVAIVFVVTVAVIMMVFMVYFFGLMFLIFTPVFPALRSRICFIKFYVRFNPGTDFLQ